MHGVIMNKNNDQLLRVLLDVWSSPLIVPLIGREGICERPSNRDRGTDLLRDRGDKRSKERAHHASRL